MAKRSSNEFVFPDPRFAYSRRGHILHFIILTVSTIAISVVAIFYSLGYQLNLKAGTIQKTGLISLDSRVDRTDLTVIVNDKVVSNELPYRSGPLFPGTYTISVTSSGYQSWGRTVSVAEDKVSSFRTIILIKSDPVMRRASNDETTDYSRYVPDRDGIEVRENELWIKGKFITRSSYDIFEAQWFPGDTHVVYQAGKTIWLTELDGLHTQKLIDLPSSASTQIALIKDGRLIVYPTTDGLYTAELFEKN